jgi:hypothetical protein
MKEKEGWPVKKNAVFSPKATYTGHCLVGTSLKVFEPYLAK